MKLACGFRGGEAAWLQGKGKGGESSWRFIHFHPLIVLNLEYVLTKNTSR